MWGGEKEGGGGASVAVAAVAVATKQTADDASLTPVTPFSVMLACRSR